MEKKTIVISAVSFDSGGPLSILRGMLSYLDKSRWLDNYRVVAIVSDKKLFDCKNVEYLEIPKVKGRWLYRLYLENVYFHALSKKMRPYLWFSLQMTPNVCAEHLVVYMHNPSPFYRWNIGDVFRGYKYVLYALFYKHIYRLNIKKNDTIVVQQEWLRCAFSKMFRIPYNKFVVAYPLENQNDDLRSELLKDSDEALDYCLFFFPAMPRPFKNFEIIGEAVKILKKKGLSHFKVVLTIDGSENSYARHIVHRYGELDEISFVGLLSQEEVFNYYRKSSCLIFPSKLETWGLPISEYSMYKKPMLIADLPYAHETASGASLVHFFPPDSSAALADAMEKVIMGDLSFLHAVPLMEKRQPFTCSWDQLFKYLLERK